jgi:hypothetical protein
MGDIMMENGEMDSNMVKDAILGKKGYQNIVNGRMVSVLIESLIYLTLFFN